MIAQALRVIADKGIAELQMLDISRGLGLTPGALYRHFRDRDEVVVEVQRVALRELVHLFEHDQLTLTDSLAKRSTPRVRAIARILHAARRYLSLATQKPAHFALISHSLGPPQALVATSVARAIVPVMEELLGVVQRLIEEAVNVGALSKGPPDERARDLWAALHGVSQTAKLDRLSDTWQPAEERGMRVARCMLRGWGVNVRTLHAGTRALMKAHPET